MVENIFVESIGSKKFTLLLSPSQRQAFITNLAAGQLLEGKVVRLLSDNTFLINFMGSKVVAESVITLKPGQQIQVRVAQTHPQVVMNLVTEGVPEQKAPPIPRVPAESAINKQITLLLSPAQRQAFIANLAEGQLLEGKVVRLPSDNTCLINFKGLEVVAESMITLKPGQQVQARVAQTHPQVVMNLVTEGIPEQKAPPIPKVPAESAINKQITLLLSPSQRQAFIANLAEGQLLEGKVVRLLSDNTCLINFKGLEVVAESMIPLKPGQQVQARVVQTRPQVVMNLMTEGVPEQKALSLIRSYLPLQINWGELIGSLSEVLTDKELRLLEMAVDKEVLRKVLSSLSSLTFDEDKVGERENIKQFIRHSGLLYESKLKQSLFWGERLPKQLVKGIEKDLKGLLLSLSQKLEEAAERLNEGGNAILRSKIGNLLKMVDSSIKRIELHQMVNYLTTKNDQQLVFQIPFLLPEGIKTAELYIRDGHQGGKKGKRKQDDFYIVFLLNMRSLGDLRIDTHLFKKRINCKIQVGNEGTANFVKGHLSELSKRLESLGYKVEKLDCIVRHGEDIKKESPLQDFSLLEMRLLDIVV